MRSPQALFRTCGSWPLYECLISEEWQKEGMITQILVSRRSPQGQIAAGVFLVDLGCLGVKNAFPSLPTPQEYRELRASMEANQKLVEADLNLVAKVLREAIAYAGELGFKPQRDYYDARRILGDADPDACDVEVPLGAKDGKPLFIPGPYDNARRIIARLTRKLGPDGFYFMVPVEVDDFPDLGDEEYEEGSL